MSNLYTAKEGDDLYTVARAHGTTYGELLAANPHLTKNGRNPGKIHPGEKVKIPPKSNFSKKKDVKSVKADCPLKCPAKVKFQDPVYDPKCGWYPNNSRIPWKSLLDGQSKKVLAVISPPTDANLVQFESSNTGNVIVSPAAAGSASQMLTLTPVSVGEADIKAVCNSKNLGAFKVKVYKFNLPVLVAESARKPGKKADGTTADDMKYGDYTKQQIKNIRTMFEIDDFNHDLDTVPARILFTDFRFMATTLFATGNLEKNITAMIDRFESNTGGEYANPILTDAVRTHDATIRFVNQIRNSLKKALNKHKGDVSKLVKNKDINLVGRPVFNTKTDIVTGLTIAINDTWAYEVKITAYNLTERCYDGKFKLLIYDHFGLDEPDVDTSKSYGYLKGFRAWFILQHLKRFAYKPFITKIELEYDFNGRL